MFELEPIDTEQQLRLLKLLKHRKDGRHAMLEPITLVAVYVTETFSYIPGEVHFSQVPMP